MDLETNARFCCPQCGTEVAANVTLPEPIWDHEKRYPPEPEFVTVSCPYCHENFRARALITSTTCGLELIDQPRTIINASAPSFREADDLFDYDVPDQPYSIFNSSLTDASVLLDEQPRWPLLNRLVFANFISTFEVFLADTLISRALTTPTVLSRLISKDKNLRDRRFSLTEIAAAPHLIKDTVHNRLRSEMWHNLPRVSALYKVAFGIDILNLFGEDTATILKAIEYRHDCVHRNGRDKDGNELDVFNPEYINEIGRILARVAEAIDDELVAQDANSFFGKLPASLE